MHPGEKGVEERLVELLGLVESQQHEPAEEILRDGRVRRRKWQEVAARRERAVTHQSVKLSCDPPYGKPNCQVPREFEAYRRVSSHSAAGTSSGGRPNSHIRNSAVSSSSIIVSSAGAPIPIRCATRVLTPVALGVQGSHRREPYRHGNATEAVGPEWSGGSRKS